MNRHHGKGGSVEKLLSAGAALLGSAGHGGVTLRAVAAQAGFSVAAVQHHFPTKERLLDVIYAHALEQDATAAWALTGALGGPATSTAAAQRVLDGLLAINCGAAAVRTAARNEALLGCARQRGSRRRVQRWRGQRLAGLAQLLAPLTPQPRAAARALLELLVGLELLSLGCREHPLTPQLNAEVLGYVLETVLDRPRAHCPAWLEPIVAEAAREQRRPQRDASAGRDRGARGRVLDAAAQVLCEQGAGALNHRSVASQAGVSVSVVSYHFRARSELLYATFQHIRGEITRFSLAAASDGAYASALPRTVLQLRFGQAPAYLGMLEAVIAAATDAELADFAWKTRILRGVYHLLLEQPARHAFDAVAFNRYAFSHWSAGATLLAQAGWRPDCVDALLLARLERMNGYFSAR